MFLDRVSFLIYSNLFEIKDFVVVILKLIFHESNSNQANNKFLAVQTI
jgi:hypothetical protein